jgi:hypothetical protein
MLRLALILLLIASAPAERLFNYGDLVLPRAGVGTVAAEAGGGLLGELALGVAALLAASALAPDAADTSAAANSARQYTTLAAMGVGGSLGAGLGTWMTGSAFHQQGRFTGALLGALAGLPVAAGMFYLSTVAKSDPLMVAAVLAPPAGAVIGYNLTRPCNCFLTATGRFLPPDLRVGCSRLDDGRTAVRTDVHLIGIRI